MQLILIILLIMLVGFWPAVLVLFIGSVVHITYSSYQAHKVLDNNYKSGY